MFAALFQDRFADLALRSFSVIALSVPGFFVATVLLAYPGLVGGWVPRLGEYNRILDGPVGNLKSLFMPALLLSFVTSAQIMRMTRSMMLEVLQQDFMRTAHAKGLARRTVIIRHALKNALMPVVTIAGITFAYLIGGTVIFESIYGFPGMGKYLLDSVQRRDYPAVQGVALVYGTCVVLVNLAVEMLYTRIDPRVSG